MKPLDTERPVESFKALLADLLKGYSFNVVGLHLRYGSIYPPPSDSAIVGKIVEYCSPLDESHP